MSLEQGPRVPVRQERVTLEKLLSETPVHGLGYEQFTPQQRADALSLLSEMGSGLDDPIFVALPGEVLLDFISYVQAPVGTTERSRLSNEIQQQYKAAEAAFYKEERT